MYNILRLFCENFKSIKVRLTEIYTCKSPPSDLTVRTGETLNVFFSHFAFSNPVNSVAQNLLNRSF